MGTIKATLYHYLAKIKRSWKERGLYGSVLLIVSKLQQSFRFRQFDFKGIIVPSQLDGPEEVKIHATKYEASQYPFFKKMFDDLDWPYQESTYVDFGCGKGATLVFASKLGFKNLIGIEYSQQLTKAAEKNMQTLAKRSSRKLNYEIINDDAALYEIPPEADCFYFFNPFDAFILDKVLQNIQKSLVSRKRPILIIYMNAVHHEVIEKYPYRQVKYIPMKELGVYFHGGAYVYKSL